MGLHSDFSPAIFPALSIPGRMGARTPYSGKGVTIALIDSGFTPYPDLTKPHNRIRRYYDAVEQRELRMPPVSTEAYAWHGTMTACTAAGNGFQSRCRYVSLAQDANLVLIRTMHANGRIPTDTICRALEWCLKNTAALRIRILNISVYADELDASLNHPVTALVEELCAAGVLVVAAAGNDCNAPLRPPATAPTALTVGGLDDRNTRTFHDNTLYHSSFGDTINGSTKPELIAPAIWLPAPILLDTPEQREAATLCALDALHDDALLKVLPLLIDATRLDLGLCESADVNRIRMHIAQRLIQEKIIAPYYKHVDGTSFAAPIVASVAAQMLEANPYLQPAELKRILVETARFMPQFPRKRQGHGVVSVSEAVETALRYGKSVAGNVDN